MEPSSTPTTNRHDVCVSASGISKTFHPDVKALHAVDFELCHGQITALIGANGSGKTTLLKILFGLLRPNGGSVNTLGVDPFQPSSVLRSQAAYVSQQQALDPEMTGRETLTLFASLYGVTEPRRRIESLMDQFHLTEVAERRVAEYSGGYRQRLHLAIGMLHEPRLLLLDEPTSGLDPQSQTRLWQTLRDCAERGSAIALATHDLDSVTRFADRVAVLSRGEIRIDASPSEIIAAHGQTVLDVALEAPPADKAEIRRALQQLSGVSDVAVDGRHVSLRFSGDGEFSDAVLAALKQLDVVVESFRRERPNLSSAYYHLTGERLTIQAAPGGQRGGRRR